MPWNPLGSVIVGTDWQFLGVFAAPRNTVIRLTPTTSNFPSSSCLAVLQRSQGTIFYEPRTVVLSPGQITAIAFPELPVGLAGSQWFAGLRLNRLSPAIFACAIAWWSD